MNSSHLWQEAASFAARAHRHQTRKDKVTPYFAHPVRVAMTIAHVFGFDDEKILAAALLHDTIEDTTTDYDDLLERFGRDVADFVVAMTKDMRLEEAKREKAYFAQLAAGPWQSRLIKLADTYDNIANALESGDAALLRKQKAKVKHALEVTKNDRQLSNARTHLIAIAKKRR
jgi:guanosine-3',5'-bis(diphosphate) 3'-pyrophosphohydrolase